MSCVILKPGKEKSVLRRHPWIFSGAIQTLPPCKDGDIFPVYSSSGALLGHAYFHTKNSLAGRFLNFDDEDPGQTVRSQLSKSIALRKQLMNPDTNAYRLVNAEGDGLPGLIVDQYGAVLVLQINTCGMEQLRPLIVEVLIDELHPKTLYEKSVSSARKQEGLLEKEGLLYGAAVEEVSILENGLPFLVSIPKGQKTGLFLDQREMRKKIGLLAKGKRVLNCFSYTGGFSLAALHGGAASVTSIDISKEACALSARNTPPHLILEADVFDFLRTEPLDYDLIILDPPAFAKKRVDIPAACQGYKEINRLALKKMPAHSLLLTSSCSSYIDDVLFQDLIAQASAEAKRSVRILGKHEHAFDHPISIYHPEGHYLKSLLLFIE